MIERFLLRKLGPEKMAEEMVKKSAAWGFKLFLDKKFRKECDFDNLSKTDQDRIFNELIVWSLILVKKIVKMSISDKEGENAEFYKQVKRHLFDKFIVWLEEIKIPKKLIGIWKKLIDLRENEYEEAKTRMRSEMMGEEKFADLVLKPNFIMVHIVAIQSFRHIIRGKGSPQNSLYQTILDWVTTLHKRLQKLI